MKNVAWLAALVSLLSVPLACATAVRSFGDDDNDVTGGAGGSGGSGGGATSTTSTGPDPVLCGNGVIDPGETCDPPASCPTSCDDGDSCTQNVVQGAAITCDYACSHPPVTACAPDNCCPAGCSFQNDPDCAGCGNGVVDAGEQCDDGNNIDTDACPTTCLTAVCGDGFVYSGVEQCDDGNVINGDGCSASCTLGGSTFGPVHTFVGMSSSFFMTQFGCSNSGGNPDGDAIYFCQHYYPNLGCTPAPGYTVVQNTQNPMMHSGTNCYSPDPTGVSVPGTSCVGGPCKIGTYGSGPYGGLTNIVCNCP